MEHAEFHDYGEKPEDSVYPIGVREEAVQAWKTCMAQAVAFYNTNLPRYSRDVAATGSKRARSAPKWPAMAIIEDFDGTYGDRYKYPHGAVMAKDGLYYMRPPL